jgi:thiamine pyrophosphate-dependent acetolactate synthase large subunit-like protein
MTPVMLAAKYSALGLVVIETLVAAGVQRICGVAGDSLNGITDALRRRADIQ